MPVIDRNERFPQTPAFVDTHVHLDDPVFEEDLGTVIENARAAGVGRWVNVGYAPARWHSTMKLASATPGMVFTLGLHPGHADESSDSVMADLEELLRTRAPRAIGEIGLDFAPERPDPTLQRRVFEAQLGLAETLRLPVVIHQRDAGAECSSVLANVSASQAVVLHSFDGAAELLALGLERGWMFGVGGLMTRQSRADLRASLQQVPLQQLILETDAPYLVPRGLRGRRNSPVAIPHIAGILATLLQASVNEIAEATTTNAARVFGLEAHPDVR